MRFRSFVFALLRRLPLICLLAFIGIAAYLFAEGYYTFSFLTEESGSLPSYFSPTGDDSPASTPEDGVTVAPGESPAVTLPAPGSLSEAMTAEGVHALVAGEKFVPISAVTLMQAGFSRSTEAYTADSAVLGYAGGFDFLPTVRSFEDGMRTEVTYERPDPMGEPVPLYTEHPAEIMAVDLYMGYLLLPRDGRTAIYTADGVYLMTYSSYEYSPANTRDRVGNPLFSAKVTEEDGTVVTKYYTASEGGFVLSDYDDELEGRGLYFDYAPSFGITDSNIRRFVQKTTTVTEKLDGTEETVDTTLWAYGRSPTWRITSYFYTMARDFSEGLAAVTRDNGRLIYLGTNGYQPFMIERSYYYFERFVTEFLMPPLTDGEESIGFYYYDHGLVRARWQIVDWFWITYHDLKKVAFDDDVLLDQKGNRFPIPAGYDIRAYSDGIILLEKDGKYGYMDYTGKWILQPICVAARPFFEGLGVATLPDGSHMMIDTTGEIVIPPGEYTYISDVSSGVIAACRKNGTWDILHKMAKFG